ncbi:2-oxoglutarate and iron-dependent oxygenase domain-containing protein [Iodobacter fluviatilis]|nr:2-oxoglutarate and iron-dependent oxygenase domain-containing protein [Iodobacter fluviatilis]
MSLPILDLSLFESENRDEFLRDLRYAARDYGFFICVVMASVSVISRTC